MLLFQVSNLFSWFRIQNKNWNFNQPQSPLPSLNSRNHRTVQICVTTSSSFAYFFLPAFSPRQDSKTDAKPATAQQVPRAKVGQLRRWWRRQVPASLYGNDRDHLDHENLQPASLASCTSPMKNVYERFRFMGFGGLCVTLEGRSCWARCLKLNYD